VLTKTAVCHTVSLEAFLQVVEGMSFVGMPPLVVAVASLRVEDGPAALRPFEDVGLAFSA